MNGISLKIVESPKSQADVVVSPSTLVSADNEVDPLAIADEVVSIKDPLVEEAPAEVVDGEKAGNCDDIAKEKNLSESHTVDGNKLNDLQLGEINGKNI